MCCWYGVGIGSPATKQHRNSLPRYVIGGIYLTLAPLLCGLALLTAQYSLKLYQSPDLQRSTTGALPSLYQQKGLGLYEGAVVSSRTFNMPCPSGPTPAST